MFLLNSRSHLFIATPYCSSRRAFTSSGHTFSRSYGAILPSSFSSILSSALEYSSHLPVSVCGTVKYKLELSGFSRKHGVNLFAEQSSAPHHASDFSLRICLQGAPTRLDYLFQQIADLTHFVPTSHLYSVREY